MIKKLCIIGCGVMGQAMVKGIAGSGRVREIVVTNRHPDALERLVRDWGVSATADNAAAVSGADIVLLALKPQVLKDAAMGFRESVRPDALVISIAAGKTLQALEGIFSPERKIVRAMPNLPALVQEGMSVLCRNEKVTEEDLALALGLFQTFGRAEVIPERLMDAAMAVAGCSPAYAALFVEAMADAGVKLGLSRQQALSLSVQAVYGTAKLLQSEAPASLKDKVCSPGGTTIEGVAALEERGFRGTVIQAVEAAARRAARL